MFECLRVFSSAYECFGCVQVCLSAFEVLRVFSSVYKCVFECVRVCSSVFECVVGLSAYRCFRVRRSIFEYVQVFLLWMMMIVDDDFGYATE